MTAGHYLALSGGRIVEVPAPSGGGLQTRATVSATTGVTLTPGQAQQLDFAMGPGYRLYHVQLSHPARLRLYSSSAQRLADSARPVGVDPSGDHGLMLEFVSTSSLLSADLSPLVDGYVDSGSSAYGVATNLDTVGRQITATLTYIRTE